MSGKPEILHEARGPALWITINRPDKRNAINKVVLDGIREGLTRAHASPAIRAVVLTGAGDAAFCAGGDLQPGQGFVFDHARPNMDYADLLREAHAATLPIIARVNGACFAGGMGLVAMADFAIAADHASFCLPEVKLGLFPMQVTSLLQGLVPRRTLREWAILGEPVTALEARDAGLVNHVVPRDELDARVEAFVARIAANSPTAIRRGKYAMRAMEAMSFEEAAAFAEGQIAVVALTEDAAEGLAAFNEKRKPVFPGR